MDATLTGDYTSFNSVLLNHAEIFLLTPTNIQKINWIFITGNSA